MKIVLLQIIVLIAAIAGIAGIKGMALQAWFTFPLLAIVLVLAIFGIVGATYFDRKHPKNKLPVLSDPHTDTESHRAISVPSVALFDDKLPNRNEWGR